MTDTQTHQEWTADLEQRIVDLEEDYIGLKRMIERIGQEKRTCIADRSRFPLMNFLIIFTMWICNFVAILYLILR